MRKLPNDFFFKVYSHHWTIDDSVWVYMHTSEGCLAIKILSSHIAVSGFGPDSSFLLMQALGDTGWLLHSLFGGLPSMWETCTEFPVSSFDLTQAQPLLTFAEWTSKWEIYLAVSLSFWSSNFQKHFLKVVDQSNGDKTYLGRKTNFDFYG